MKPHTKFLYPILIIILGLLVYSNCLFTGFVWDDKYQIVQNQLVHSPVNIPIFFISSIGYNGQKGELLNIYYKPMLFSLFSILYSIGHGTTFPFHLFQLTLHIINTILLFCLFKKIISSNIALLTSLIFLVHPVNEATVVYISSLQDPLFFFFGIIVINILVYKPLNDLKLVFTSGFILLLSLFSKETGILFLIMAIFYELLFDRKQLASFSVFMFLVLFFYSLQRIRASNLQLFNIVNKEPMRMSILDRISLVPRLTMFYLRELILPSQAVVITSDNLKNSLPVVNISLTLITIFSLMSLAFKTVLKGKYFYPSLFFLVWFLTGLALHLQIVPLDALAAKRWLYFPLAGFLGLLGVLVMSINISQKFAKYILLFLVLLLIGYYGAQTYNMNFYWQDENKINNLTTTIP